MDKLTAKQEAFCQGIADGKTQADAYRAAYDAENMTDKSIWEKASELMATVKVSSRVAELKQNLEEKQLWTRMDSVNGLVAIFRNSKDERPAVAINAIKELNNMHGFNAPTQVEIKNRDEVDLSNLSDDELQQLAKIKGKVIKKNANPESD